jgi:hypothetical protein
VTCALSKEWRFGSMSAPKGFGFTLGAETVPLAIDSTRKRNLDLCVSNGPRQVPKFFVSRAGEAYVAKEPTERPSCEKAEQKATGPA